METVITYPEPGKLAGVVDLGSLWLTYHGPVRTVSSMETKLILDDGLMERLQEEATRRGRSVSDLVEEALRLLLKASRTQPSALPPLPTFDSGGALVDISDR